MNVLFVAHSGEMSGGANRTLLSIMQTLRSKYSISPSILIPDRGGELQKICADMGIPVYIAHYHTCCTVFRHDAKDILRIIKIYLAPIEDFWLAIHLNKKLPENIDLIYTNERMAAIGGYLSAIRHLPHIWHIRSFADENNIVYAFYYTRIIKHFSNRIVLISNSLYRNFALKFPPEQLMMIHNGVNIDQYSIKRREYHKGFHILLCGRIVPPKGQLEALRAFNIFRKNVNEEADLYFAGEIPTYEGRDYYEQLCHFIKTNDMTDSVHFLGKVEKITELRESMDLELVCSWCEAFGRVTVEAMCAGLPVVGSCSGGTPDIIQDGVTGLLYEPHHYKELAEKIGWIYQHPEQGIEMGKKGYQRAAEMFSLDVMTAKINMAISRVVSEKRHENQNRL